MSYRRIIVKTAPGYGDLEPTQRDLAAGRLPEGAVCIYPGKRNQLYSFPTPHGQMVVKCFQRPNLINSFVYTTLRKSKAARSYLNSFRLKRFGIGVPEPVAYAEERVGMRLRRSWYVCREVPGETVRFYECRPDCERLLTAIARDMLRMHLYGVYHKDFSPGNVIVEDRPDGTYNLRYVDLNRMEFGVDDHEKQLRMFERINYTELHTSRLVRAYTSLAESPAVSFQGLYPLLRPGILLWRERAGIEEGALQAFRRFWQKCARKKHLFHRR